MHSEGFQRLIQEFSLSGCTVLFPRPGIWHLSVCILLDGGLNCDKKNTRMVGGIGLSVCYPFNQSNIVKIIKIWLEHCC